MIFTCLLECVTRNYMSPDETLVSYRFIRKLNRARDTYDFLLVLELESNEFGIFFEREILLGTNLRK